MAKFGNFLKRNAVKTKNEDGSKKKRENPKLLASQKFKETVKDAILDQLTLYEVNGKFYYLGLTDEFFRPLGNKNSELGKFYSHLDSIKSNVTLIIDEDSKENGSVYFLPDKEFFDMIREYTFLKKAPFFPVAYKETEEGIVFDRAFEPFEYADDYIIMDEWLAYLEKMTVTEPQEEMSGDLDEQDVLNEGIEDVSQASEDTEIEFADDTVVDEDEEMIEFVDDGEDYDLSEVDGVSEDSLEAVTDGDYQEYQDGDDYQDEVEDDSEEESESVIEEAVTPEEFSDITRQAVFKDLAFEIDTEFFDVRYVNNFEDMLLPNYTYDSPSLSHANDILNDEVTKANSELKRFFMMRMGELRKQYSDLIVAEANNLLKEYDYNDLENKWGKEYATLQNALEKGRKDLESKDVDELNKLKETLDQEYEKKLQVEIERVVSETREKFERTHRGIMDQRFNLKQKELFDELELFGMRMKANLLDKRQMEALNEFDRIKSNTVELFEYEYAQFMKEYNKRKTRLHDSIDRKRKSFYRESQGIYIAGNIKADYEHKIGEIMENHEKEAEQWQLNAEKLQKAIDDNYIKHTELVKELTEKYEADKKDLIRIHNENLEATKENYESLLKRYENADERIRREQETKYFDMIKGLEDRSEAWETRYSDLERALEIKRKFKPFVYTIGIVGIICISFLAGSYMQSNDTLESVNNYIHGITDNFTQDKAIDSSKGK